MAVLAALYERIDADAVHLGFKSNRIANVFPLYTGEQWAFRASSVWRASHANEDIKNGLNIENNNTKANIICHKYSLSIF